MHEFIELRDTAKEHFVRDAAKRQAIALVIGQTSPLFKATLIREVDPKEDQLLKQARENPDQV